LASIFWGTFTFGRVLGIPLSLRFGPTEILAADLVGALCAMLALISLGTTAPNEQALQVLTALFGLSMACTYPQAKVLPTTYGYAIDGKYMSIIMVAGSLGNVFFVMCVAQLFGAWGPQSFCPTILGVQCLSPSSL
jgi:fucose permease